MKAGAKGRRKARRPSLLLSILFVFFTTGVILVSFSSTCIAAEIRPPTDRMVDEWIDSVKDETLASYRKSGKEASFRVLRTIKVTKITLGVRRTDGVSVPVQAFYYLWVVYEIPEDLGWWGEDEYYSRKGYKSTYWAGYPKEGDSSLAQETGTSSPGWGSVSSEYWYDGEVYASKLEESILNKEWGSGYQVERGWRAVAYVPETVPPGPGDDTPDDSGVPGVTVDDGGEGQPPEGGSKIPGPGSWWEWLMGTVVAGAIAAGAGLVSTIFGGAGLSFPPQGGDLPGGAPYPAGYHPALGLAPSAVPPVVAGSPGLAFTPTRSPLTEFPGQYAPDYGISYGTADPFDIHGVRHPHQPEDGFGEVLDAAVDAVARGVADSPAWALDRLKDAGNWVKEKAEGFTRYMSGADLETSIIDLAKERLERSVDANDSGGHLRGGSKDSGPARVQGLSPDQRLDLERSLRQARDVWLIYENRPFGERLREGFYRMLTNRERPRGPDQVMDQIARSRRSDRDSLSRSNRRLAEIMDGVLETYFNSPQYREWIGE